MHSGGRRRTLTLVSKVLGETGVGAGSTARAREQLAAALRLAMSAEAFCFSLDFSAAGHSWA